MSECGKYARVSDRVLKDEDISNLPKIIQGRILRVKYGTILDMIVLGNESMCLGNDLDIRPVAYDVVLLPEYSEFGESSM